MVHSLAHALFLWFLLKGLVDTEVWVAEKSHVGVKANGHLSRFIFLFLRNLNYITWAIGLEPRWFRRNFILLLLNSKLFRLYFMIVYAELFLFWGNYLRFLSLSPFCPIFFSEFTVIDDNFVSFALESRELFIQWIFQDLKRFWILICLTCGSSADSGPDPGHSGIDCWRFESVTQHLTSDVLLIKSALFFD